MSQTCADEAEYDDRELELTLAVRPRNTCPLRSLDRPVVDVRRHATEHGFQCDIVHRAADGATAKVRHSRHANDVPCPGTVFLAFDCVPHVSWVDGDTIGLTTLPPSRDVIWELLQELERVTDSVSVQRISRVGDGLGGPETGTVDFSGLTGKQREAIERAVEAGYYRHPREATITDIAAEVGISQSAFSQRLRSAEEKLVHQLFVGDR